ncbi:MAG: NAD(P)-binding domain-containing protein [Balneolaceae bacterium]|nr:NAD(P)-binding domain-containing protein [Balneolaceae bacterium]
MEVNKVGILGSGSVGTHLGAGFAKSGYSVKIGSRSPDKLSDWAEQNGEKARAGTFDEAASFGDVVVLATKWLNGAAKNAILLAGEDNLKNKIVIDVTNPLLFSEEGKPPTLSLNYPESGGKTVQEWLPGSSVVKAFNSVTAAHMANPKLEEGNPDMFICGDDPDAKQWVQELAEGWGWTIYDLGGIDQSYLLEALALIWVRYGFLNNHWTHAFKLLQK